jgi:branched-chain amino acid transport system permease protein
MGTAAPVLLAIAVAFPLAAAAAGQDFYVGFATRVMIFALAASSLGLVLGLGGMVSFGHAAFLGLGAYTVAVAMERGIDSAWIAWPAAMAVAATFAALIGAVSLRTRGVYFIMITLAFAQMVYYLVVSTRVLGGDDGLALAHRSTLGPLSLQGDATFYYVVLAILAGALFLLRRLANARFGRALQAIRENEVRMEAIGFPVLRVKLAAFVIAGAVAGLAGALLANQNGLVGPGLLGWQQSGLLMVMVILGGVRSLHGGLLGAAALLALEEVLSGYTVHAPLAVGALLLAVVLFSPDGIAGLARGKARDD